MVALPTIPINHYFGPRNQQNKHKGKNQSPILLFHANVFSGDNACFKHSNFFKVNDPDGRSGPLKGRSCSPEKMAGAHRYTLLIAQTAVNTPPCREAKEDATLRGGGSGTPYQKSNYELFNCNNFNIRYWSWNYRGCWHQTCPPIGPR